MTIDPSTNSRFTDLGGGTYSELIAKQVQLFYDPSTGQARAHFNGMPFLLVGTQLLQLNANNDILEIDFSDKMTTCYADLVDGEVLDPVTGASLKGVSIGGFMTLCKIAYDVEHNARAASIAAQIAAAEALAAQAAALAAAKSVIVSAGESPSAGGTTAGATATVTGLTVGLLDASTAGAGLTITGWTWTFGDELGSSTEQNPTYTYAAAGTYTILLAVADSSGVVTRGMCEVTVS
jgi:FOG: PKD repeat